MTASGARRAYSQHPPASSSILAEANLKTVIGASQSRVQIPAPPPFSYSKSPFSRIVPTDLLGPLTGDLTGIFSTTVLAWAHKHEVTGRLPLRPNTITAHDARVRTMTPVGFARGRTESGLGEEQTREGHQ